MSPIFQRTKNFKDLFCKRGLEYLQGLFLPAQDRFILERLLEKKAELECRRAEFDQYIQSLDFHAQDLQWLRTVPGMNGALLKYIVLSEIDNVGRFRHAKGLVAYCGLIPKERSSGDKTRKGHLRTQCNQFLRWAMIQAVLPAIRQDKALRAYYQKVKERKNSSAARIATARILLKAIYHVLKEQRPYRMQAINRV